MRLLVNTSNLSAGGGLQVAYSLLEEWIGREGLELAVLFSPQLGKICKNQFSALAITEILEHSPSQSLRAWREYLKKANKLEKRFQPDAVVTIFGPSLWKPKVLHLVGFANGLYLFDNSFFIRHIWPQGFLARLKYRLRRAFMLNRLKKESSYWWVETAIAQEKLATDLKVSPAQILIAPNTIHQAFEPYRQQRHERQENHRPFRFLTMAANHPNKNLALINSLLPLLEDVDVEFSVTLMQKDFDAVFGENIPHSKLKNFGPISPQDAAATYLTADAVFLPTLLETASASYPEAMVMGLPILTSNLPFAHEACSDAAVYFNPSDAEDAAKSIRRLISDANLRKNLVELGFERAASLPTATMRADKLLHILQEIAGKTATGSIVS